MMRAGNLPQAVEPGAHSGGRRNPSSAVIGNLLASNSSALEATSELARATGHFALADKVEAVSVYLSRLAAEADSIPESELNWRSFGTLMSEPTDHDKIVDSLPNPAFQFYLRKRLQARFPELGPSEIETLLCLLEHVGSLISTAQIHLAIRSRSPSGKVVKVYVSRLRASLSGAGLARGIETGRNGYRFNPDFVVSLVKVLRAD